MKSQSYMTRAMQAHDPRFAKILGKLGYARSDLQAAPPAKEAKPAAADPVDEMKELRAEYQHVLGKRAFNGWDAETLRSKIVEAKG